MRKQRSFTLIELLVVIVIIGILAGVIIVSTSSSISKANFAKAQAFSNTVQQELLLNLVSEWTFDNASKLGEDTWGNNDGTVHGAIKETDCVYGSCMRFNGTDDYIGINSSNSLHFGTEDFTISFWMKSITIKDFGGIFYSGDSVNGIALYSESTSNILRCWVRSSDTSFNLAYSFLDMNPFDNKWNFVVFSANRNSGYVNIYQNGKKSLQSLNISSAGNIDSSNFNLGRQSTPHFNGFLDDVRIYNATLSSSQIKKEYIAGLNSLLAKGNISEEDYLKRIGNKN